jgi:hypothetical protein
MFWCEQCLGMGLVIMGYWQKQTELPQINRKMQPLPGPAKMRIEDDYDDPSASKSREKLAPFDNCTAEFISAGFYRVPPSCRNHSRIYARS